MATKSNYINELNSITTREDWLARAVIIRSKAAVDLCAEDFSEVHSVFFERDKFLLGGIGVCEPSSDESFKLKRYRRLGIPIKGDIRKYFVFYRTIKADSNGVPLDCGFTEMSVSRIKEMREKGIYTVNWADGELTDECLNNLATHIT